MKNIHVLPTDKPTWLHKSLISGILRKSSSCINDMRQSQGMYIYITSDEEIKEGDWVLDLDLKKIVKADKLKVITSKKSKCWYYKKIILTTDQDLIKDGVQAIDDEFLEWFVKNPSCEFAHLGFKSIIGDSETKRTWKIIIPKEECIDILDMGQIPAKEEPKKIFDLPVATNLGNALTETMKSVSQHEGGIKQGEINLPSFKQEFLKQKRMSGAKTVSRILEESKQETLEEAAERMYSEEEVIQLLIKFNQEIQEVEDVRIWFEQFKKK